jgi:hypothetical protein
VPIVIFLNASFIRGLLRFGLIDAVGLFPSPPRYRPRALPD